jgi:outer membrane biosynthesis protein TonB
MAAVRADRYPAMAASAALHAAIIALALISWPWAKTVHFGDVVAVTLVSSAEAPAPAQAVQAPAPAPAQTEAPVPKAAPQPAAPVEAPTPAAQPLQKVAPTPPTHAPAARPTPKTAPQTAQAAPSTQPKTKQQPAEDWNALAASLSHQTPQAGARQSQAARGPARPNQAVQASLASGTTSAAAGVALASLTGELQRMWNPVCGAPGSDATIKVTFKLGPSGRLTDPPRTDPPGTTNPADMSASELRAMRPVRQAEPFDDPQFAALYGQTITVNFNQKSFCSNR